MKKNLKLLSGILVASFISTPIVDSTESVKARTSRQVVVNTSSNQVNRSSSAEKSTNSKNSNKTSDEVLDSSAKKQTDETSISSTEQQTVYTNDNKDTDINDENLSTEVENTDTSETQDSSDVVLEEETTETESQESTSIFEMLNSDKNITVEEITSLSMPLSHSQDFIDEFNTAFPDLNPLRKLTSTSNNMDLYLDVNLNETKTVTQYLNSSRNYPSVYADQNKCNMLINEIDRLIEEINTDISTELPSTLFSLMPTVTVFSDTFNILSLEYNSVLETNSNNQIVLKILLKDVEDKLVSLLSSINEFRIQLPELIEELDSLAKLSSSSSSSNTNKTDSEIVEDELLEDEFEEIIEDEILEEEIVEEEIVEEEIVEEDTTKEEIVEEVIEESKENTKEEVVEEEEEVDPNSVILYFGDQGQELVYDKSTKKYYQLDPENPDSEDLVEYSGEVTKMTLAEYLDVDVYFDKDGNELLYDADTDSYFSYDVQKDEFVLYEGEVTKLKIKDILELDE